MAGQAGAEIIDFAAPFLQQGHQRRFPCRLGQHLHQNSTGATHATAIQPFTHEHRRGSLLGMQQIGGEIIANPTTNQLHRAAKRHPLADITNDVQIAGASGPLKIKLGRTVVAGQQIKFQVRFAHVAPHRAVAPGIHRHPPQGTIGLDAQIDPAMGHLHRTGQQQARRHRTPQQGRRQKRQSVAAPGLGAGFAAVDRHQADPAPRGGGPQQLIRHQLDPSAGIVRTVAGGRGLRQPSTSCQASLMRPANSSGSWVTTSRARSFAS